MRGGRAEAGTAEGGSDQQPAPARPLPPPGRAGTSVGGGGSGWQRCGRRSALPPSRPAPGQPAAASGLSSWEQRRGSSSSGSSSVTVQTNPLFGSGGSPGHPRPFQPWGGGSQPGRGRAGWGVRSGRASSARGESALGPADTSLPRNPSGQAGPVTDPAWDSWLLRRRRGLSLRVFTFRLVFRFSLNKVVLLWAREEARGV